jgi:hypothetical protein
MLYWLHPRQSRILVSSVHYHAIIDLVNQGLDKSDQEQRTIRRIQIV